MADYALPYEAVNKITHQAIARCVLQKFLIIYIELCDIPLDFKR